MDTEERFPQICSYVRQGWAKKFLFLARNLGYLLKMLAFANTLFVFLRKGKVVFSKRDKFLPD